MNSLEFVLWLNGALDGNVSMEKIREKLDGVIGKITADKILDRADALERYQLPYSVGSISTALPLQGGQISGNNPLGSRGPMYMVKSNTGV